MKTALGIQRVKGEVGEHTKFRQTQAIVNQVNVKRIWTKKMNEINPQLSE